MPPLLRAAHHHFIAHLALTGQERHRGGADVVFLYLAVLLFNTHMQGPGDGIAQILNTERPRRHLGFINHAAHLADGHFCRGVCHPGNIGGVATQIGRQHLVVGADAAADIVKAVENIGVKVILAERKFGFQ